MAVPTDYSNLWCWLKADAGVYKDAGVTLAANGETVQQWNDQSGNGRNFSQATSGMRPVYTTGVQNSLPGVRFDATDDGMSGAVSLSEPYTIFCVYSYRSATSATRRAVQGGNNWLIGPYNNKHSHFAQEWIVELGGPAVIQNAAVVGMAWNDADESKFLLNNSRYFETGLLPPGGPPGTLHLGRGGSTTQVLNGDIFELVVYDRALTDAEIAGINAYLGVTRYAIWATAAAAGLRATQGYIETVEIPDSQPRVTHGYIETVEVVRRKSSAQWWS